MAVHFEHAELVKATPEQAFAVIDNLPMTSRWLPPCVSLEKIGTGPNAPGDRLRYVYTEGGRQKEMAGEIVARTAGEQLLCRYGDRSFEVSVDLRLAAAPGGALTTHVITITPKTFLMKLLTPVIRVGIRKQTTQAAANLKSLLESAQA